MPEQNQQKTGKDIHRHPNEEGRMTGEEANRLYNELYETLRNVPAYRDAVETKISDNYPRDEEYTGIRTVKFSLGQDTYTVQVGIEWKDIGVIVDHPDKKTDIYRLRPSDKTDKTNSAIATYRRYLRSERGEFSEVHGENENGKIGTVQQFEVLLQSLRI